MKKLLLTLLLLFSVGMVAKAQGFADELTSSNFTGMTYTVAKTYTSSNDVSYTAQASSNNGFQLRTSKSGTGVKNTSAPAGYKISSVEITFSRTGGGINVYASDSEINLKSLPSTATNQTSKNATIEVNAPYFAITATNDTYCQVSKIVVNWVPAGEAEKVTLEDANLEVKAGEQVLGSEAELSANTTISWTYNYTGEVANPDITYSYSVDGGEEVEGNEYTYTGEKDVELTVKATSTNTVSKTVKLLKKYPTVCPEPVFNVEDGAKVYAGQAVTVSCEGADIEWTVNDVTITGTSYTITEEVGTQLTFYALASIEGRNPSTGNIETLTAENKITVTVDEATEALFNFEAGNTYGLTSCSGTDYEKDKGNLTAISNGIVTLSFTEGSNYRFWGNDNTLRIYKGCTLTASVPEGYYITNITMTGKDLSQINYSDEFINSDITVSSKDYEHVTQTGSANIKTLTVKYAKVPDPELDGEPTINVTHASKKGVLIVEYSFKIANHNGKPVEVTANVAGMEHIAFTDATPANAPARVAGESTTVSGTLRAEHADLVDASNLNVNLKATLDGQEFFTRQATVTTTTGIEDVTVEGEGEAEYFNLQGLRVAQPEAGQLYIKRQAGKAVKVRF